MSSGADSDRLAVLVHEIRSPVAALAAIAGAAESRAGDSAREDLVRLAVAACRGIERLLLDAAATSVRFEPVDAGALADDAVADHVLRGNAVALERDDDGLVIEADAVRLRQALENLISNALAYGGGRGVIVRATRAADVVRLAVSDAGPGIPASEHDRIFEPGVRLAGETPGAGLGLALARAIVAAHGGTLSVESSPGAGATFTIELAATPRQLDTRASSS